MRVRFGLNICNSLLLGAAVLMIGLAVSAQTLETTQAVTSTADALAKKDIVWLALVVAIAAILGMVGMAKVMKEMHTEYMRGQNESTKQIGILATELRAMTEVLKSRPCMHDTRRHE